MCRARRILLPLLAAGAAAVRAASFVLIDETAGLGYGPFPYADGTPVLDGRWSLALSGPSVFLRAADGSESHGPFAFTNQAVLNIGKTACRVLFVTPEFEEGFRIGRHTRAMREALRLAAAGDDPRAAAALLEQARATNTLHRNGREVEEMLKRLTAEAAREEALRAAGKVKFEGRWLPAAEAETLRQEREAAAKRAQGLQLVDGEWLTIDAAAARRREKAAAAARELARERRRQETMKCPRCKGTGSIYFELRPAPSFLTGDHTPDLKVERPGRPPEETTVRTEVRQCPDCRGSGQRRQ